MTDSISSSEESDDLAEHERKLQRLEQRIGDLKGPKKRNQALYAKGIGLVLSFGFVLAGCLIAGLFLGDFMVQQTGYPILKVVGILIGLVVALLAGVKLMGPFLKSDE